MPKKEKLTIADPVYQPLIIIHTIPVLVAADLIISAEGKESQKNL